MFLFTVTKPGLRQAGALALCAVCLAGTVTAAVRLAGRSVAASATVQTTIENTQDIGTYFTGYGFEVDLSTAAVDKVKIPKKWDDSFTAFNQVVGESGLTLVIMNKIITSMSIFSKLFVNFAAESSTASLKISIYWSMFFRHPVLPRSTTATCAALTFSRSRG